MTAGRRVALAVAGIVLICVGAYAWLAAPKPEALLARADRPPLLLLTSLPLMFGEGFSIEGGGSPALAAIEKRYRTVPISVTSDSELARGRMLLMAHPQAQTAEHLVALDKWVRGGGRVLLLADPLLEWRSERPLGDPLRPPPMFADTGLLAHWGLRLDAPDEPGPAARSFAGRTVSTLSPGRLRGSCTIEKDGFVARCRLGMGNATVVADADFLAIDQIGPGTDQNIPALIAALGALESR